MSDLPRATLGRTGLDVTRLGFGAMELRGQGREVSDAQATAVLNAALDAGINYVDTSPDYGVSEERIGGAISHRRDDFFLASKVGCPVDGNVHQDGYAPHDFSRRNVRAGVEQSLRRMSTEYLDVVQFHISPSRSTLEEEDSIAELEGLRQEGKLRFIGVSGTLPNLTDHIEMGVFDVFQIPYSGLEREHEEAISAAAASGGGTVIRGGVARGVPQPDDPRYSAHDDVYRARLQERRDRLAAADLSDLADGMTTAAFLLRFTLSHPDLHTTIVGTVDLDHLAANVETARKGPLPADVLAAARERLAAA